MMHHFALVEWSADLLLSDDTVLVTSAAFAVGRFAFAPTTQGVTALLSGLARYEAVGAQP